MDDLHQFISQLEERGELVRISAESDPVLEIAAVSDRVCKHPDGGKALLFEHPSGSQFPVATNLFGSVRRVCLALGGDTLGRLTERFSTLLDLIPDPHFAYLDRQISSLAAFTCFAPLISPDADTGLKVMDRPDLGIFPFLQTWPEDGSAEGFPRYITLPLVYTAEPDGSNPNCGMYRCQIRGADHLALRWKPGSGAGAHLEAYGRLGRRMPVAIALGAAPAAVFSAMFPLPGNLDEMTFAGFMRGKALEMVPCRSVPLHVPRHSGLVIEGYVDPGETVTEGPFGNHTGSYSPAGAATLLRVTSVSYRTDAVIPATVVGPPPMEDCWMGKAWEAVLLALIRRLVPGVANICIPLEWMFHQSAVIYLDKSASGMVRETVEQLWNLPWFSGAKLLVFVNDGEGGVDMHHVAWQAINLVDSGSDLISDSTGKRLAVDATVKDQGITLIRRSEEVARLVEKRWKEYEIIRPA